MVYMKYLALMRLPHFFLVVCLVCLVILCKTLEFCSVICLRELQIKVSVQKVFLLSGSPKCYKCRFEGFTWTILDCNNLRTTSKTVLFLAEVVYEWPASQFLSWPMKKGVILLYMCWSACLSVSRSNGFQLLIGKEYNLKFSNLIGRFMMFTERPLLFLGSVG